MLFNKFILKKHKNHDESPLTLQRYSWRNNSLDILHMYPGKKIFLIVIILFCKCCVMTCYDWQYNVFLISGINTISQNEYIIRTEYMYLEFTRYGNSKTYRKGYLTWNKYISIYHNMQKCDNNGLSSVDNMILVHSHDLCRSHPWVHYQVHTTVPITIIKNKQIRYNCSQWPRKVIILWINLIWCHTVRVHQKVDDS